MPQAKGKILVIRGGAIGDFVLTLPVLAILRERFPEVHLELLGYPRVTPLALAGGLVDQVQSIEARPLASFFAKNGALPEPLADYFRSFALVVSYLYDPDRIFQENVARCSKAQFLVGPHRPDENGSLHATDAFLKPLERLAIFDADPTPRLDFSRGRTPQPSAALTTRTQGRNTSDKSGRDHWLALHPGSGSDQKNWPEAKWSELLQRLAAETSLCFLIVGGEAEGERLNRLAALIPIERRKVALSRPLEEVASLLQQCRAFIGHDSGISHLAAAVGLRGLVLWADTRQHIWRPRSERIQVLQSPGGLAALDVREVLTWVWNEQRD